MPVVADQLWVSLRHVSITEDETVVPVTCDYLLTNFSRFATKGFRLGHGEPQLKIVGDATHNKSSQNLRILVVPQNLALLGVLC